MKKYEYNASYLRRLIAFIVDFLICDLVLLSAWDVLLLKYFDGIDYFTFTQVLQGDLKVLFLVIMSFMTLMMLLYFIVFTYILRQTPGMMIMRLRVVSLKKEFSIWQMIVRNLFLIPFFPFPLLWIVEPLHLYYSSEGQRWTEKISFTKVVQEFKLNLNK